MLSFRAPAAVAGVAFVALLLHAVSPPAASADLRLWEQNAEEDAEGDHRFFDLTAFLQPGFILRQGDEYSGVSDTTFWLRRARLGFRAQLTDWLRARMEIEFAPTPVLADGYLELAPHDYIHLRVGQFGIPFLRAYLFNELNLGFLDRPLYTPRAPDRKTIRYLSPRDVGAMISGRIGDLTEGAHTPVFEYQLGMFIGQKENQRQNNDDAFLYAGRLQLHILGLPEGAQAESDLARNTHPRIAAAASVYSNCDDRGNWNRGWNVDAEFRYEGLYASASFVWFKNGPALENYFGYGDFCGPAPEGQPRRPRFVSRGAHFQLQYVLPEMLFPVPNQALELLARVDWSDPNSPFDPNRPILGGDETTPGYAPPSAIDNSDNAPTQMRLSFGLNWFPTNTQQLRLGINYQHVRELEDIVTTEGYVVGVKNDVFWIQITAGL